MNIHSETIKDLTEKFLNSSKKNLLFCEGIDDTFYGTIPFIKEDYKYQCFELPCSENASVALVLGASCYGLKPIICFQRVEFALLAFEQFVNNSSKISYLSANKRVNPSLFKLDPSILIISLIFLLEKFLINLFFKINFLLT